MDETAEAAADTVRARVLSRRGAAVLCAVLSCGMLTGCMQSVRDASRHIVNANRATFPGGPLTVVTFNMLHGFGNRLNDQTLDERLVLLRDGILSARPDIVILQEASLTPGRHGNVVDTLRESLNQARGTADLYNSAWAMANGSVIIRFFEGSAILSRFEILTAETLVYRAQALLPPEHRVAVRVRVRGARADLAVIGTHLTNTEARRRGALVRTLQAQELATWAGGAAAHTIIGGDFNAAPGSLPILALIGVGVRDAWVSAAGKSAAGLGRTGLNGTVTDPNDSADERIDYIFLLGDGAEVETVEPFLDRPSPREAGGVLWASDHVGVLARIRVR